jgi:hypothetical protein
VPVGAVPFPRALRERLGAVVGPGLDRAELHVGDTDPAADTVARTHDAAAVTVGQQIFLRQGRFRPSSPEGRGLLAHEAVHAVLAGRPGTGWRRATAVGRAEEEAVARAVAAAVGGSGRRHAAPGTSSSSVPAALGGTWHRHGATATGGAERLAHPVGGGLLRSTAPGTPAHADPTSIEHTGGAGPPVVVAARRLLVRDGHGAPTPPDRYAITAPELRLPGRGHGSPGTDGHQASPPVPAASPTPTGTGGSTAAAATPMAASAGGAVDPAPAAAVAPVSGPTRDTVLREIMREVRTDRERGA